jgi:hypothetical protein
MNAIRLKCAILAAVAGLVLPAACARAGDEGGTDSAAPKAGASQVELNAAIDEVISRPEYAWRLPRSKESTEAQYLSFGDKILEVMRKAADYVVRFMRWLDRWLEKLFSRKNRAHNVSHDWQTSVLGLWYLAAAFVCSILAVALYRLWRNYRRGSAVKTADAISVAPDIADENIQPDVLPSDEWMKMAHDFLARGEFRPAIRAMFLACLAFLAGEKRITPARYKSNREYFGELCRKARDTPVVIAAFRENMGVVEESWYGTRPVTKATVDLFDGNRLKIFEGARGKTNAAEGGQPLNVQ